MTAPPPGVSPSSFSTISLYFGCRHERQDFLYATEWETHISNGSLTELHTAFSRDGESLKKVYVQQRLEEHGEEVARAIASGAYIFIAGNVKLPACVLESLKNVLMEYCGLSKEASKEYLSKLQRSRRICIEAW